MRLPRENHQWPTLFRDGRRNLEATPALVTRGLLFLVRQRTFFRRDQRQLCRLARVFSKAEGLPPALEGPNELGVLVRPAFDVFPGEELVFARSDPPQPETTVLIGGGGFVKRELAATAWFRHQHNGRPTERALLIVKNHSLALSPTRAEQHFEPARRSAAAQREACLQNVFDPLAEGLGVEVFRHGDQAHGVRGVGGYVLKGEGSIWLDAFGGEAQGQIAVF